MANLQLNPIGVIASDDQGMRIVLDKAYVPALTGLDDFSHIQVLWWFGECDTSIDRSTLIQSKPYKQSPDALGTFATRSPMRPNPIGLDCVKTTCIDHENGIIGLAYIEAFDGSPVLDIKPYTPSLDRVENPAVPNWCSHWPSSHETSGDFDWESEMNY